MWLDACRSTSMEKNPYFSGRYSATWRRHSKSPHVQVSILVLVEGTLQQVNKLWVANKKQPVSILVLVEGTLQLVVIQSMLEHAARFNPCFSGRYSATTKECFVKSSCRSGFNPCFSGRYSAIIMPHNHNQSGPFVSILVLVEGTLQLHTYPIPSTGINVSILVLVEGTLQFTTLNASSTVQGFQSLF